MVYSVTLQHSDMNDEMRTEAMELCVTACEKFSTNNEVSHLIAILIRIPKLKAEITINAS